MGYKSFGTAVLVTSALFATTAAQAATYPEAGGSSFDNDSQGWSSLRAECSAANGTPACTQENAHDPQDGNPAGAIVARTRVIANGGELFRGESTWRSPTFVAQASSGTSVLQYHRRFEVEGLVAVAPKASVEALVVDDTTGVARSLGSESLTDADSAFVARRVTVPAGTLVAGRSYRIELRSSTTTTTARLGVLGTAEVEYDNVRLDLPDPSGASGSPGVTFAGSSLSSREISELIQRLSLSAEFGTGPGGSLVPLARCTIVGTPGKDRIRGSRGNDVICGLGGNDKINGGRGRDIIDGADGNDGLAGAAGADLLLGLRGLDRLSGGAGKDRIGSGAGADRAQGGSAADKVLGVSGADRLNGGSGKDRLAGGAGRDRIAARDRRRDRVDGGKGRDRAKVDRGRGRGKRSDRVRRVERMR
ncbi:MAG TPA: calcium-binding protein [Thermoleophilaceae bacterium]|nr:calcium-binding protein [Thermoleophilaceae bacterium]